jgi:hypothetical protein
MATGLVQPVAIREGNQAMVSRENVNCEQIWAQISSYIDGDLDATQRAALEEHVRTCKHCASVLAGMQNVIRLYGDERMLELPAGFSRRLQKRLGQSLAKRPSRWLTWEAWLIPVTAIMLFAGGLKLADRFIFHPPAKSILALPGHDVPPDMQVVISDGSKLFHRPGCPFIHDKATERTITAKEAMQEGYTPCARCLRQYLKTGLNHSPSTVASGNAQDEEDSAEGQEGKLNIGSVTK